MMRDVLGDAFYGKSGCGIPGRAGCADIAYGVYLASRSRRLSLAVNSSSMVVQRPNSPGRGERAGLEGKIALITGAGQTFQAGIRERRRRVLRRRPRDGCFGKLGVDAVYVCGVVR
jgi:hypothetical protein